MAAPALPTSSDPTAGRSDPPVPREFAAAGAWSPSPLRSSGGGPDFVSNGTPHGRERPVDPTPPPASFRSRLFGFLRRHPVLCLLLLTPGIPEYLSGSSPLSRILWDPAGFVIFLGFNVALYGPGVLLIREAAIRWRKGWASIVALGGAYAILEEGIALDTFFYPQAGPVGTLGQYGHWLGVSWVWVAGVAMVHIVYSISLPILIHGYALPETRGRSLLSERGIRWALVVLVADVVALALILRAWYHFSLGLPLLVGSLLAVGVLVWIARRLPAGILRPLLRPPAAPRWTLFGLGLVLLTGTFLLEGALQFWRVPAALSIAVLVALYAGTLEGCRRALGRADNARGAIAFAAGALVPILLIGVITQFHLPLVLLADSAAVLLLWSLWKRYPDPPGLSGPPETPPVVAPLRAATFEPDAR